MRIVTTRVSLIDLPDGVVLMADLPDEEGLRAVWVGEGPEETMTLDPERAGQIDGRHAFSSREEAIEAVNVAGYFVEGDRVKRVSF